MILDVTSALYYMNKHMLGRLSPIMAKFNSPFIGCNCMYLGRSINHSVAYLMYLHRVLSREAKDAASRVDPRHVWQSAGGHWNPVRRPAKPVLQAVSETAAGR